MEHIGPRLTRRKHGRSGWSYRIDGNPLPSVTRIISEGMPKPALMGWYAGQVARCVVERRRVVLHELSDDEVYDFLRGAPFRARDAAANRGTEVHRLAAELVAGRPVEPPPEIAAHVEHYASFLDIWGIEDADVERPCFHLGVPESDDIVERLGYGGTFDLRAYSHRLGERAQWDIKTSGSGIFGEIALQHAGYGRAHIWISPDDEQRTMEELGTYMAIWVTAEGYDVFRIQVTGEEWKTFRAAARVAWWREHRMEQVVGDSMWSSKVVRV